MRITGYIPHPDFHVTVFEMNHRYSIKVEWQGLEQWYKLRDIDPGKGISAIQAILSDAFWSGVSAAFDRMRKTELLLSTVKDTEYPDDPGIL